MGVKELLETRTMLRSEVDIVSQLELLLLLHLQVVQVVEELTNHKVVLKKQGTLEQKILVAITTSR